MKRLFTLISLFAFFWSIINADTFEYEGIKYDTGLSTPKVECYYVKTVEGTCKNGNVTPGNSSLSSVITIPETVVYNDKVYTVVEIGDYSFSNNKITKVNLPESIVKIGKYAFYGCSDLAEINLPEGITNIGEHTFQSCSTLKKVDIPVGVREIGMEAFSGCTNLEHLTIPGSVEIFGSSCFQATNINSLTIPSKVSSIEKFAFAGGSNSLPNLKTVYYLAKTEDYLLNSRNNIQSTAFTTYFKNFPDATLYVRDKAAAEYITDSTNKVIPWIYFNNNNNNNIQVIPTVIIDNIVYGLNSDTKSAVVFGVKDGVTPTSVDIPSSIQEGGESYSVTAIGEYAFEKCTSLQSITLPVTLTEIRHKAFCGCSNLSAIEIPDNVGYIASYAFNGCESLENLKLPEKLVTLEEHAFSGCTKLKSVYVPANVHYIGDYAFSGDKAITSVTYTADYLINLGQGLNNIFDSDVNENATLYLKNETRKTKSSVIVPWSKFSNKEVYDPQVEKTITSITLDRQDLTIQVGNNVTLTATFSPDDTNDTLSWLISDNSLATIDSSSENPAQATISAIAVGEVTVTVKNGEGNVTAECKITVEPKTFEYENSGIEYTLTNDDKGNYVAYVKGVAEGQTNVNIPASITVDGNDYSVVKIEENAFNGCLDLTSVNIPESVTSIGENAFSGCENLMEIIYDTKNPKQLDNGFPENIAKNAKLVVNPEVAEKIKKDKIQPWNNFTNIEPYVTNIKVSEKVSMLAHSPYGIYPGVEGGNVNSKLIVSIAPDSAKDCIKLWGDKNVFDINEEIQIYGQKAGEVTITITADDYKKSQTSFVLTVKQPKPGDSHVTGTYEARDIINTVSTVLGKENNIVKEDGFNVYDYIASDANGDGLHNIADVTKTVELILTDPDGEIGQTSSQSYGTRSSDDACAARLTFTESDGSLLIGLDGLPNIVAFQAYVTAADPNAIVSVAKESGAATHSLMSKHTDGEENSLRFVIFSFSNDKMTAAPEAIARLSLDSKDDSEVTLSNIIACDANGQDYHIANVTLPLLGGSGVASISAAKGNVSVYTTNGICLLENATNDDLKGLDPGVYVVIEGGKSRKLVIK